MATRRGGMARGGLALAAGGEPEAGAPAADAAKRPAHPGGGVSRKFDPLFKQHSRGLPVAYLRALAKRESDMNPRLAEPKSGWGLLQVIEEVRRDYNKR